MCCTLYKRSQNVCVCQNIRADYPSQLLTFPHSVKMAAGHGDQREMYLFWRTMVKANGKVMQQNVV